MSRQFYDKVTRTWVSEDEYAARRATRETPPKRSKLACPQVAGDIPEYVSPLGTGVVSSRSRRREEMKRHGVREVDPGEFKPAYRNPRNKARAASSGKERA